jgi:hypothetical protein
MLTFIAIIGASLLYDYYRIPAYTLDAENGTITRNGIIYRRSVELLGKYQNNEIEPVYTKAIRRLKGDNPLWLKTFIYKFDGICEGEAFLAYSPFMNLDFYERAK